MSDTQRPADVDTDERANSGQVPQEDLRMGDDLLPDTQGRDPLDAELGGDLGQGDVLPEDDMSWPDTGVPGHPQEPEIPAQPGEPVGPGMPVEPGAPVEPGTPTPSEPLAPNPSEPLAPNPDEPTLP